VVVVIDELALYIQGKGKDRDDFALGLRDLVARGRAAGIVVVAATQKPAADVVPTAVRDLFGYRLALRCSTKDASDTVLGTGWAAAGFSSADIDPATRGVGLLLAESGVPRRLRCHHLTDADIAALVARASELRSASTEARP
jgi:S-DNA-T family DNA segregation ATPase FtsK/SpoIIIE